MCDVDIETYLSKKKCSMNQEIKLQIEALLALGELDSEGNINEDRLNHFWCMKQIFLIQEKYLEGYYAIRKHHYEHAWNLFDSADIAIGNLLQNFDTGVSDNDKYHIIFIRDVIKEYVKLFPYRLFFSREGIIKKEVCSICGNTVRFRGGCTHELGRLYRGKMCYHIVEDYELTGIAIVENPFDRYAFIRPVGKEYNYEMLDFLMRYLESPYEKWHVDTSKRVIKQEYIGIGRNELCPCNSGKKFKKCCMDTDTMYTTHYDIIYDDKPNEKIYIPFRYTSTYKD